MPSADKPSLYERLGGVYSIATVVRRPHRPGYERPETKCKARSGDAMVCFVHQRIFKYLVTEMVCWASGGPQKYTGRSMADSHVHLKITGKEWEAFLDDFQRALDKFAVPTNEQAELKTIVNSTRSDIVADSVLGPGASS